MNIIFISVGKLKEKWENEAFEEYSKRIGGYAFVSSIQLKESRLPDDPSQNEINAALDSEADEILKKIPSGSAVIAMCIEGKQMPSEKLAQCISDMCINGKSTLCFIIGSSFGMSERVKERADIRLSMSLMTFPHRLARIMAAEQIYRALSINANSKYHK